MLLLTRRVGETFMVGDTSITILGLKGNQVRVGVVPDKDVSVHREDVYEKMKKDLSQYNKE